MKNPGRLTSFILACLVAAPTFLAGCTTERASQTGAPLESKGIRWDVSADLSIDANRKLTGSAKKVRLLFFTVEAPSKFVDGVFVSNETGLLTWLFGGAYDDLKAAAAYEAVYGKADVLVNPQWVVSKDDYLFCSVTRVTVTGYPGTIVSFRNGSNDGPNRPTAGTTRAFANPPLPLPANPPSRLPPASDNANSATRLNIAPADTSTASSLRINDVESGSGPSASPGDMVSYHYTCRLQDGTEVFDSRGQGAPRQRSAGSSTAPAGLGEGLVGAKAGMHRRLVIPPNLGYGSSGLPSSRIPPDATLIIDLYIDHVTRS